MSIFLLKTRIGLYTLRFCGMNTVSKLATLSLSNTAIQFDKVVNVPISV